MSIPKRTSASGTYFVTSGCWNKRSVFQVTRNAELFITVLEQYRQHYLLHGFVVMPDHVHIMLTPLDVTLERAMQFIKGGFSFRLAKEFGSKMEVWQKGFTDHRILDPNDYRIRLNYIFQNPVRAALTESADLYPFSSANGRWKMDQAKIDLGG